MRRRAAQPSVFPTQPAVPPCCPLRKGAAYDRPVDILAAKPWTYWMALPVLIMGALGVLSVILGYLRKAVAPKYPKQ